MRSIFNTFSLDRSVSRWEESLGVLTPWENLDGMWFKREDKFAPLGYGGPNGSKMRQLIHYMNRRRAGKTHVLTGASIQSPPTQYVRYRGGTLRTTEPSGGL